MNTPPALLRAQGKPLTIVLTVPPGTSSDTLARMITRRTEPHVKLH